MKKILLALAGTIALVPPIALTEEAYNKTYLFVETATKADLKDGKLVLYGVDDEISVFSDRPYRSAGVITRDHFFDVWSQGENSFDVDPPNAALSGEIEGSSYVLIIEISSPKVDGEKVTYSYNTIHGDDIQALNDVVMFIDSFSWRPPYTGPDGDLP
ncbi:MULTISPECIES: hypothetical protein [unclassified Ruegeria]|uniref:hypothetical protein n=1 Tax=unclassified Ruegeria TaxID=2625375 RepID=UPI001489F32F|nr:MULTISPECIES: hypothetical protein [unclassified Ruegeria]